MSNIVCKPLGRWMCTCPLCIVCMPLGLWTCACPMCIVFASGPRLGGSRVQCVLCVCLWAPGHGSNVYCVCLWASGGHVSNVYCVHASGLRGVGTMCILGMPLGLAWRGSLVQCVLCVCLWAPGHGSNVYCVYASGGHVSSVYCVYASGLRGVGTIMYFGHASGPRLGGWARVQCVLCVCLWAPGHGSSVYFGHASGVCRACVQCVLCVCLWAPAHGSNVYCVYASGSPEGLCPVCIVCMPLEGMCPVCIVCMPPRSLLSSYRSACRCSFLFSYRGSIFVLSVLPTASSICLVIWSAKTA